MAETLVEKGICEACGAKVRNGSAFCFNCGEHVAVEPLPPAIVKPDVRELQGKAKDPDSVFEPEPPPVMVPVERLEHVSGPVKAVVPAADIEAETETPQDLKTAAAVRRQARTRVKKPVELEWVERQPSILRFLIAAILLTLIAGGLLVAALYLR